MASIEQRGRSFRVVFRYRGRRFARSLRTADEKQATATLARLEDNLRRVELGTLSVPEASDVATFLLSDGRQSAKRERSEIRTLSQLLSSYFENIPPESLEENTIDGMRTHRRHLERLLGENLPIQALQFDDLQTYVDRRSQEPGQRGHTIRPATIKKELRTLTCVWNWAIDMQVVRNPLPKRRLRYPRTSEKPRFQTWQEIDRRIRRGDLTPDQEAELWACLFLTTGEIDELLAHVRDSARHPFIYPMFCFAAHTGARRSEMLRSEIDDIDFYTKSITIREKKRVRGTTTTRTVPLAPELDRVLTKWFDEHPGGSYTFCHQLDVPRSKKQRDAYEPLTKHESVTHFRCTLAESKWEKLHGWHVFRHSFCSNCASAGIDQRFINAWVGHQTEEMVRRYRHLIPNQQLQEIQRVFVTPQPRIHVEQSGVDAEAAEVAVG
jgi:integrase